jgi:hypothetical protein
MTIEITENLPEWLPGLIAKIGDHFCPLGFIGQLGFRYLAPDAAENATRRWLIGVYLIPYELSGGKNDGASVVAGFCFNLHAVVALFSKVETLEWRVPRGYTDGLAGPEVWLEGYLNDLPIQLHVYADCPADELPSLVMDVATNTLRAKQV